MDVDLSQLDPHRVVGLIDAALDVLAEHPRLGLMTDTERMDLFTQVSRVGGRARAIEAQLAAALDTDEVVLRAHGASVGTWLSESHRHTRREAGRIIHTGRRIARFELVADAVRAGRVLPAQADAIASVLNDLPTNFDTATLVEAQEMMIGFADTHDSAALRQLTNHLVEVLDPIGAEDRERERIEREHRLAQRDRHLTFTRGKAQVSFRGSLPTAEAEEFLAIVNAYAAQVQRGIDRTDLDTAWMPTSTRRADGLIAMVRSHQRDATAPNHGGDRPRVVITLDYAGLAQMAVDAGFTPAARYLDTNEPVPAGVLRQWLCDADVLPVVLGGASEPLDVGRDRRLVTPAIRRALEIRDGGCVFPGCDKPPRDCHAHHIDPWALLLGETKLENLVLLCAHHHRLVEPSNDPYQERWRVFLDDMQVAHVIPPRRVDPNQRPRTHVRNTTPARKRKPAPATNARPVAKTRPGNPSPQMLLAPASNRFSTPRPQRYSATPRPSPRGPARPPRPRRPRHHARIDLAIPRTRTVILRT